jgi:hypothetical protein
MEYSTTQQRIAALGHRPVLKKSTFVIALGIFGFFSILSGVISLVSVVMPLSNFTIPNSSSTIWIDAPYELFLGAWILVSALAFAEGKFFSVWLYGGSLIIDSLYHMLMGYPLNYLFIGFGLVIIWQILKFRSELDLI